MNLLLTATRRAASLVATCLGVASLVLGAYVIAYPAPVGANPYTGATIAPSAVPAFDGDSPDPDVLMDGSRYYAFTTGTTKARYIQALCNPTGSTDTGWALCPGGSSGASALPNPPAWQERGTQNAPGVYVWQGLWIMFYTAALSGHQGNTGANCLSVATDAVLTPSTVAFTDRSSGPLVCNGDLGGAIDPSPYVDPATGQPYLVWKTNDGGSTQSARLWSQPLGSDGMTLVGQPSLLQVQNPARYPFETTIENPQIFDSGGNYYLLFSTGIWNSASYSQAVVGCAGPLGPCGEPSSGPFLTSYGAVAGPGGGTVFQDARGGLQLAYAGWSAGCTSYACGGTRRLFISPVSIEPAWLPPPITGIAAAADGSGYWLVNAHGGVSPHGAVRSFGSVLGLTLNAPIEHLVPTPDAKGYWLVAGDGGIFSFGDARFFGSMGAMPLNAPVVGLAPTSDGGGYWLVASDGGVFAFGNAKFSGSMGGVRLNAPVVGIASDVVTGGYWLVASDGGVFAFGAPFAGSTGSLRLSRPVNAITATADGQGYWFVASDGGVFAFGDAKFSGSTGALTLAAPVVGMAADLAHGGYWLVGADGGVFAFDAPFLGAG